MPQSPVDRWRPRGIVGDQYHALEAEVPYYRVEVPGLVVGGVGVALWLVRASPTEEVENHNPPPRQVWHQPVVEVQIVWEAVHQHDRGFLPRELPRVYAVLAPRHLVFFVLHLFTFFPRTVRVTVRHQTLFPLNAR